MSPAQQVKHPSPKRYTVHWLHLLASFAGAPTAWAAQTVLSESVASYACYPHQAPLPSPLWPGLMPTLTAISVLAFLLGLAAAGYAWLAWQRTRHEAHGDTHKVMDVGEGRTCFLALISVYSSGLFLLAILFTACSILLVTSCQSVF